MRIEIRDLTFEAIVGILEHERRTPQRIIVDITIDYRYEDGRYIDYAAVCDMVQKHIQTQRFELLEEALESTAYMLKKRFDTIESLDLRIAKPDILPHATVALRNTF